jgi:hypothetical protein
VLLTSITTDDFDLEVFDCVDLVGTVTFDLVDLVDGLALFEVDDFVFPFCVWKWWKWWN